MADRDEADRRVEEGVVQIERLLAGHAEDVAHALLLEAADEELGSGHGSSLPAGPPGPAKAMIAAPRRFC